MPIKFYAFNWHHYWHQAENALNYCIIIDFWPIWHQKRILSLRDTYLMSFKNHP
jgi:hypothetical protein